MFNHIQSWQITSGIRGPGYQMRVNNDGSFSFSFYSSGAQEISGYTKEEVHENPEIFYRFIMGDTRLSSGAMYQDVLKNPQTISLELKATTKDGETRWIRNIAEPYPLQNGDVVWNGVIIDITERVLTQEALKESEAYKTSLLNDAPNPILVVGLDEAIIYVNHSFENLTGYNSTELIGHKRPYPFCPPEKEKEYLENKVWKIPDVDHVERQIKNKNGELRWVDLSTRHIKEHGVIKCFIANWIDITERKQAQQALLKSEEKYKVVTENAPFGLYVFQDGHIKYFNEAFIKLTGYTQEELFNINFLDLIHPDFRELIMFETAQALTGDTSKIHSEFELKAVRKNGEVIWTRVRPCLLEYDGRIAILGNVVDITELKLVAEKLEQSFEKEKAQRQELEEEAKSRGMFIDILAHELRTPLTPILASATMLRDVLSPQGDDIPIKLAKNIYSGAQTLAQRLEELLDLARCSRGTFKLQLQPVDLRKFLDEVIYRFQPTVYQSHQRLVLEIPADLPVAEIDSSRLEQVIVNLLSNASKFSPDGSDIIFRTRIEDRQVYIEVKDNGIGISEGEQKRLFSPYHRVEQDRQKFNGLGLGLTVCKQIVEAHGGQIRVTSQSGKGSVFSFYLPLK
jgi:PAS domain S-box-containing protein